MTPFPRVPAALGTPTPTVSVIIPTRDRPHLLEQALASVAAQRGVQVEAVVVNDGGCDVKPVVEKTGRSLETRLITFEDNHGLPAARNAALDAATGDYCAFLDDDDVFLPGHLATSIIRLAASGAHVSYTVCPVSARRITPGELVNAEHVFDFPFHPEVLDVGNFIPVTAAVTRRLDGVDARFDESLPVEEDWDMWLQLHRRHGLTFVHVPQTTVVYHRLREPASMTSCPTSGTGGRLAVFQATHRRLMRRWPVAEGTPTAVGRRHLLTAYALAEAELAAGRPLAHFYYERVIRLLYELITGKVGEDDVPARLAEAVTEESP